MEYPWSLFTCKYIFFILFFSLFVSDLLLLCLPLCSRQPPQPNHKTTTWPGLSQRLTQPKNTNSEIGNQTQNHYQQNQTQTKIKPNPNSEIITRNIKTKINLNPTNWKTQNKTINRKPITQTQTWLASWQPNSGRMSELGAIDEVQQRERERERVRERFLLVFATLAGGCSSGGNLWERKSERCGVVCFEWWGLGWERVQRRERHLREIN